MPTARAGHMPSMQGPASTHNRLAVCALEFRSVGNESPMALPWRGAPDSCLGLLWTAPCLRGQLPLWTFLTIQPEYWSFSFSISPSNEYSGLISFRMDWFNLLAVQGPSRVFSRTTVQKHQFFSVQLSFLPWRGEQRGTHSSILAWRIPWTV